MAAEAGVDPFQLNPIVGAVKSAAEQLDHLELPEPLPESVLPEGKQFALPQALESAKQGMGLWQHGIKGTQMYNAYLIQGAERDFTGLDHASDQQVKDLLKKVADGVPTIPGTGDVNSASPDPGPPIHRPLIQHPE